jgi:hypothetical protein
MKIRFQADNDLDQRIVIGTRRLDSAIDFQSAPALGLHLGVPDEQVLALAAQQSRILVTHDRKTMPDQFERFIATRTSPGLIVIAQSLAVVKAAEWLHLIWAVTEREEYTNSIYSLP